MALQGRSLSFGYRSGELLIQDASFTLNQGEVVGVAGANGAGKSTLLNILCGYLAPRLGQVCCDEIELSSLTVRQRALKIAVVPQNVSSPMPYTVEDIVKMGLGVIRNRFTPFTKENTHAVENALNDLDITHLKSRRFNELSGGEQQRVVIASSIVRAPRYLLLDEPTSHLDLGHAVALLNRLRQLCREYSQGTLIISHDIQMMARFCDRIILMKDGCIVGEGAPKEVVTSAIIRDVYNCDVDVIQGPDDRPVIIPSINVSEALT